ncbi:flavin reductase family protein [Streptomyces griseorubiginosus]|uniref:flavin reductase family protein n=1 Tax=Streptomyces griseorubiginosus TaxID=67304 RepID=UPI001AD7C7B4|nr:flavin reductase family protein [Streptomyces griseorubiginosus]MBO4256212.1 flavin reductase [Streptomyces griseorubiginosus]
MSTLETIGSDPDTSTLRRTFGCFPTGVAAVCAEVDGEQVGMAVSSFTSVSLSPPLVSVCIGKDSSTWPKLRQASAVGVSVLSATHDLAGRQLASRTGNRFEGLTTTTTESGALHLEDAVALFECRIHEEVPAGDHIIVLLRVLALAAQPLTPPLVFHGSRFHQLAA